MALTKKITEASERELRQHLGEIWNGEMTDLYREVREGKTIPQDKEEQFDKFDKEIRAIEIELQFREREEKIKGNLARTSKEVDLDSDETKFDPKFNPNQRQINRAMRNLNERGAKKLNTEERKIILLLDQEKEAFEERFRFGSKNITDEQRIMLANVEKRVGSQSTSTTAGGFLIPQGFIPEIIRSMKFISSFWDEFTIGPNGELMNTFSVFKTDAGNDLPIPTGDDTTNIGELLAENTDGSTSTADLVFGQKTFKAYNYSTKMIKASNVLLQDSAIDIPSYVAQNFGSRIGRISNLHLTTGDNSAKPQGIVTGATVGKIAGTSGALSFLEILDLEHSVDPSYRNRPSCRFMMHDTTLLKIKKLTVASATNNARPLWAPGYDVKAPATIDGFQYLINQDMATSITAGSKIMLFGDMKAYGIRLVNQFRLLDLRERYAEFDQIAWIGFMRLDGRILNASAIKYYAGT